MSGHDGFCALPNSLVSSILSKLLIKEAVRSSIFSKRWRFLYTQMPTLTFSPYHFPEKINYKKEMPELTSMDPLVVSGVEDIISNMFRRHSGDLEGFHADSSRIHFSPENVHKWVEYASEHNVHNLYLSNHTNNPRYVEEDIPHLFSCLRLVTLSLTSYILTSLPNNFVGLRYLISCCCNVQLTGDSLASLVSYCPLLQELYLTCEALDHPIIVSSTIEHLGLYFVAKSLIVNYPKLRTLECDNKDYLSVNGVVFNEFSYAVASLRMHPGGILTKLQLDFEYHLAAIIPARRFLDIMGNLQSLKKLILNLWKPIKREENMESPLWNLFHRLPNLETIYMKDLCVEEMSKDPIPHCLSPPHFNLKKIRLEIVEFGHKEVEITNCLLQSMHSLEALEFWLPDKICNGS